MKWFNYIICSLLGYCSCAAQDKITVFFDFNKYDLNPVAITTLNDWILEHPKQKVLKIYGFCDEKGTNQYNDTLSLQRVQTVFDFLKSNQVEIDKDYLVKGFGENFTQDKNPARNRKVEIIYAPIPAEPQPLATAKEDALAVAFSTAKTGDLVRLKNIHFFNNSARVVPESKAVLYDLLCVLQENPTLKIEIQGHICCQSAKSMDHISTARARAVYNYLIQNKIKRERLSYKGYGVSKPLYAIPEKNDFEENENRRVEIKIVDK